jgi:uncharacterized protein
MDTGPDQGRRRFMAAALVTEFGRLFEPWLPQRRSYDEWFNAIRLDDTRRVKALLDRGFDPATIEPERFDTGLIVAVRQKSPKVFHLLLSTPGVDLDARSRNGDTALMIAALQSETGFALALIDKGAQVNRPGWTALHYAASSGNVAIIRRLLEESAFIDAESPNRTTPLMMAARGGHAEAVKLLLDEGADVMLKNELGLSAADFARAQGHGELARQIDALLRRRQPAPDEPD